MPPFTSYEFSELFAALRAGSKPARDELFRRYYDRLVRLVSSMLGQFTVIGPMREADSINSDLVIKLMKALQDPSVNLVSEEDFFRLAAHKLRFMLLDEAERIRRRRRLQNRQNDPEQRDRNAFGVRMTVEPPAPEQSSIGNLEEWDRFHKQVKALPEEERKVVELHLFKSMSQADVAETLGWTPKQVSRKWLAAASKLGDYVPGGPYSRPRQDSKREREPENSEMLCPKC